MAMCGEMVLVGAVGFRKADCMLNECGE